MITREEYNKALDVVIAFQEQIFNNFRNAKKTDIIEFVRKSDISTRTSNSLLEVKKMGFDFIEDVNERYFLKARNAGIKSWAEFDKIRNEYLKKKHKIK